MTEFASNLQAPIIRNPSMMMKMTSYIAAAACFLFVLSLPAVSSAQSRRDTLLIVPARSGMYFYHVVAPKQTLYSLSRSYHLDVHKLAAFNHLDIHTRLKAYQLIRIPLTATNFNQTTPAPAPSLQPLYHKVIRGETLYHIAQLYDKVALPLLRRWNHLQGNEVRSGQFLIVGWLGAAKASAPAVASAVPGEPRNAQPPAAAPAVSRASAPAAPGAREGAQPGQAKEQQAAPKEKEDSSAGDDAFLNEVIAAENDRRSPAARSAAPAAQLPSTSAGPAADAFTVKVHAPEKRAVQNKPAPAGQAETVEVKHSAVAPALAAPAKAPRTDSFALMLDRVTHHPGKARAEKPVTGLPAGQTSAPGAPDAHTAAAMAAATANTSAIPAAAVPDAPAVPAITPVVAPAATPAITPAATPALDSAAAVIATSRFFSEYESQTAGGTKTAFRKGAAGWFHSNVKPGSGAYYALCNDLPRGTVVKVVNPLNRHAVLVKVLDVIPRQKENYNLVIKLSDAAMADLGTTQPRFWCKIIYPEAKKEE
jgi:LysM repeat protein